MHGCWILTGGQQSSGEIPTKVVVVESLPGKQFKMQDYVPLKRRISLLDDGDGNQKKKKAVRRPDIELLAVDMPSNLVSREPHHSRNSSSSCSTSAAVVVDAAKQRHSNKPRQATNKHTLNSAGHRHEYSFLECCESHVFSDFDQYFMARKEMDCSPPFRMAVAKFASSLYLELHNLDEDAEEEPFEAVSFHEIMGQFIKKVFNAADDLARDIVESGHLYHHYSSGTN